MQSYLKQISLFGIIALAAALMCVVSACQNDPPDNNPQIPSVLQGTIWENDDGSRLEFSQKTVKLTFLDNTVKTHSIIGDSVNGNTTILYFGEGRQAASYYIKLESGIIIEASLADFYSNSEWTKKEMPSGEFRYVRVNFKMNDGNGGNFRVSDFKEGSKITKPELNPERYGYEFTAWYNEPSCLSAFDFSVVPVFSYEINLYAGWREPQKMFYERMDSLGFSENVQKSVRYYYYLETCEEPDLENLDESTGKISDNNIYMMALGKSKIRETNGGGWPVYHGIEAIQYYGKVNGYQDMPIKRYVDFESFKEIGGYDEFKEDKVAGVNIVFSDGRYIDPYKEPVSDYVTEGEKAKYFIKDDYLGYHGIAQGIFGFYGRVFDYYGLYTQEPESFRRMVTELHLNQLYITGFEWDSEKLRFNWVQVGENSMLPAGKYIYLEWDDENRGFGTF